MTDEKKLIHLSSYDFSTIPYKLNIFSEFTGELIFTDTIGREHSFRNSGLSHLTGHKRKFINSLCQQVHFIQSLEDNEIFLELPLVATEGNFYCYHCEGKVKMTVKRYIYHDKLYEWLIKVNQSNLSYFKARRDLWNIFSHIFHMNFAVPDNAVEILPDTFTQIWHFLTSRNDTVNDDKRLAFTAAVNSLMEVVRTPEEVFSESGSESEHAASSSSAAGASSSPSTPAA
jgi:hypothetical protein